MADAETVERRRVVERVALDLVEKGSDDVLRTLEVRLGKRPGDEVFVSRRDVRHVIAGCNYLSLVGRVLDMVLDVFEL
jgi:hypothetical protein